MGYQCSIHQPPCLLRQAALPIESVLLKEIEILNKELPSQLPPQVRVNRGLMILTGDIEFLKWSGEGLVRRKAFNTPQVEEGIWDEMPSWLRPDVRRFKRKYQRQIESVC